MSPTFDLKKVFILIPSYNEAKVIAASVSPLFEKGYTVVVVDDCSTDNTREALKGLPVIYLRHEINLGQGAAIQTGFDYAIEQGAEYAVTFDADGQHNCEEIPLLLEPIVAGRADIAMGTRFKRKEDTAQIPAFRKFILKGAILVNGIFTGLWLTDAHNGFRALNRRAFSSIKLQENRMAHASEILSQVRQYQLRYEEVPVNVTYSDYSKMKGQNSMNSVNILIDLLLKKIL
jgi:polyprenyl-phospho-N-acetylgalactosaminyl synthase